MARLLANEHRLAPTWLCLAALLGPLAGCAAGPPPPPSTPAQRAATPESITRDNPGGDAVSPVDAALTRLLEEPVRPRSDRFETLLPHFADAKNWKRVRFWGYPTRAGFRYGKKALAVAAVLYWEAENDRPSACLQSFVKDAGKTARLFDVEVTDPKHSLLEHPRGVEALDEETIAAGVADFHEKRKARVRAWKKRRAELRRAWRRKRRAAIARRRRRLAAARRARAKATQHDRAKPAATTGTTTTGAPAKARTPASVQSSLPERPTQEGRPPASSSPREAAIEDAGSEGDHEVVEGADEASRTPGKRRALPRSRRLVPRARPARATPPKKQAKPEKKKAKKLSPAERRARDEKLAERRRLFLRAHVIKKLTKELGTAPMPAMIAEGRFSTLLTSDHYVTGMVAYRSWPGTCLVQAFATKVGTDPTLARAVRDRWLEDQAPALRWRPELTEAPPIKNR